MIYRPTRRTRACVIALLALSDAVVGVLALLVALHAQASDTVLVDVLVAVVGLAVTLLTWGNVARQFPSSCRVNDGNLEWEVGRRRGSTPLAEVRIAKYPFRADSDDVRTMTLYVSPRQQLFVLAGLRDAEQLAQYRALSSAIRAGAKSDVRLRRGAYSTR